VFSRIINTLLIRNAHRTISTEITLNSYAARTQRLIIAGLCAHCINCMMSTRSLNIRTPPPSTEQPKTYLRLSCHVHRVLFGSGPQTDRNTESSFTLTSKWVQFSHLK